MPYKLLRHFILTKSYIMLRPWQQNMNDWILKCCIFYHKEEQFCILSVFSEGILTGGQGVYFMVFLFLYLGIQWILSESVSGLRLCGGFHISSSMLCAVLHNRHSLLGPAPNLPRKNSCCPRFTHWEMEAQRDHYLVRGRIANGTAWSWIQGSLTQAPIAWPLWILPLWFDRIVIICKRNSS